MIYSNPSSPTHDSSAPFSPTSPPFALPAIVADTDDPLLEVEILADGFVICQFSVTATFAEAVKPCANVLCTCPAHSEYIAAALLVWSSVTSTCPSAGIVSEKADTTSAVARE